MPENQTLSKPDDSATGGSKGLDATTCSRLADLLPPREIVDAACSVWTWMNENGYANWQLGGICDRRIAENRDKIASERDGLLIALHDAINRPKGVVPKSAERFYQANDIGLAPLPRAVSDETKHDPK